MQNQVYEKIFNFDIPRSTVFRDCPSNSYRVRLGH